MCNSTSTDSASRELRLIRPLRPALGIAAFVVGLVTVAALVACDRKLAQVSPTTSAPTASAPAAQQNPMTIRYDGRMPTDLDDARVSLPDFHHTDCPTGPTQFLAGRWKGVVKHEAYLPSASIDAAASGDVNHDGTTDVVALVTCEAGTDPGAYAAQVVAWTKDTAGTFALLGQVAWVSGGTSHLRQPEVASDGSVRTLLVPASERLTTLEQRTYRWNGDGFGMSGKSDVVWDSTPTKLTITATRVPLSDDGHGGYRGTARISVANGGGATSTALTVQIAGILPAGLSVTGLTAPLARSGFGSLNQEYVWTFVIEPVQAGTTATTEVTVSLTGDAARAMRNPTDLLLGVTGDGIGAIDQDNDALGNMTQIWISRS